jgi:hypothetical protein
LLVRFSTSSFHYGSSPRDAVYVAAAGDSEHPLPDSDPDVIAALNAYGASFTKVKKNAAAHMDLLAGLMWVHAQQFDLHAVWSAASVAQHRALAAALRLDYDLHAASSTWLIMIVCTVLSCIVQGATQE